MIPRFSNPHAIFENAQVVSRKQLYETEQENDCFQPDTTMVDEYNKLMKRTLPQFDLEKGKRKRRKLEVEPGLFQSADVKREPISFRLISNGPPVLVFLEHTPQVQIKVKEPETEDTVAQAMERQERAIAVAVDADCIMGESLQVNRHTATRSHVLPVFLPSIPTPPPPVLILRHDKPVRKTRPPVFTKLGYPYDVITRPEPLETPVRDYPVIDLSHALENIATTKRKRRRRKTLRVIEHKFWQPDPRIKGKCMGYAMGYTRRYS